MQPETNVEKQRWALRQPQIRSCNSLWPPSCRSCSCRQKIYIGNLEAQSVPWGVRPARRCSVEGSNLPLPGRDRRSFFPGFWQIKHPCPLLSHSAMAWRWDWQQQPSAWHQSTDWQHTDWHARDWQQGSWWGGSSWQQDASWEWPDDKANKDQPKSGQSFKVSFRNVLRVLVVPRTLFQVAFGHRALPGPFRFLARLGFFDVPHFAVPWRFWWCFVVWFCFGWGLLFLRYKGICMECIPVSIWKHFDSKTLLWIITGDENVSIRLVLLLGGGYFGLLIF